MKNLRWFLLAVCSGPRSHDAHRERIVNNIFHRYAKQTLYFKLDWRYKPLSSPTESELFTVLVRQLVQRLLESVEIEWRKEIRP